MNFKFNIFAAFRIKLSDLEYSNEIVTAAPELSEDTHLWRLA